MNVLVVCKGEREHALVWKLAQSQRIDKLYVAPGNPGMAALAECVEIRVDTPVAEREKLGGEIERLVSCRRDSFTKSFDFRKDGIGRRGPHERVCVGVPLGSVSLDALDEL